MRYRAEIVRKKDGVSVDTPKTFKDFDTAACYIANRSSGFVPWSQMGGIFRPLAEEVGNGVTTLDFGSEAYVGKITEVDE